MRAGGRIRPFSATTILMRLSAYLLHRCPLLLHSGGRHMAPYQQQSRLLHQVQQLSIRFA